MNSTGDAVLVARQAMGMTQGELCEAIGVTQATLSRYENNLREPDAAGLQALSKILGLSVPFLTHNFRIEGAVAVDAHMRREKTTKASVWKRLEARLNLLRMQASFLLERLPLHPDRQVPQFDPFDTRAVDAALMVRAQWRMPIGPVRNLTRWLESAGVLVVEEDFGTLRVDGLSQWAGAHPIVLLNSAAPTDRRRLTLAHELGHLVLHSHYLDADAEAEATAFAAEFLMPEHVIKPALRGITLGRLVDLKAEWGVSMQALYERAYQLGMVTSGDRSAFHRAMNARGWKTREPAADRVPLEQASLLASIGHQLAETGLTAPEMALLYGARDETRHSLFPAPGRRLQAVQ